MAASVSYRINGKYDGKAVTQAKGGMSQLTSSAKTLNGALKSIDAKKAVKEIVNLFKECTSTFKENNAAQTQMFQALSNNSKIAEDSVKGLVKQFDAMAGVFSGADLVKGGTLLARLGLDETQMKKATQAAKDLASSGLMTLDQAFEALGKSYNGNITSLKKMFPEVAKFTKAELEAGKAVELLGQKFAGMEDAFGKSFEGQINILKNKLDGIKDTVGSISGFILDDNNAALNELIDKITKLADESIPGIAAWISTIIHTLTNFDLFNLFNPSTILEQWKDAFVGIADMFVTTASWIKAKLKDTVNTWGLEGDREALVTYEAQFAELEQKKNENLRRYGKAFLTDFEKQRYESIKFQIQDTKQSISDREETQRLQGTDYKDLLSDLWAVNTEHYKKALGYVTGENMVTYWNEQKAAFNNYKDGNYAHTVSYGAVGTGEETDNVTTTTSGTVTPAVTVNEPRYTTDEWLDFLKSEAEAEEQRLAEEKAKKLETTESVLGQFGELGEVIMAGIEGSWFGVILKLIGSVVSELSQKSEAFSKLINVVTYAAQQLVSPEMVKLVNAISGPIMNGITSLVDAVVTQLEPWLELLGPVFWVVGKVVDTIGRVVETISAVLYNIYVAVWNIAHSGTKNDKSFKSISDIWADYNDWGEYVSPTAESSSYDSVAASSSASYSAQRDIYVTITYNHSFVNGDAREIAVQLRNEIASAERLGY